MSQSIGQKASLITDNELSHTKKQKKPKIHFIIVFAALAALTTLLIVFSFQQNKIYPIKISIPWYENKKIILQLGTYRVFQPVLYSGKDNRTLENYIQVTQRQIQWSVEPQGIITADMYGRIKATKIGNCLLKVKSKSNGVEDARYVEVIGKWNEIDNISKRVIHYQGQPADTAHNLQKLVQRLSKQQALKNPNVPSTVKYAIQHLSDKFPDSVLVGNINWTKMNYANGSPNQYILRVNNSMDINHRDRKQYFIGDRYLPDNGLSVVMIQKDDLNGIWVVGNSGNVTHISMVEMSYRQKAQIMNEQTQNKVIRQGLSSGADWDGQKWVPEVSDNDGLWTSIYGAGELMKYSVLRQKKFDPTIVKKARQSALNSLKAVLLIANVAGREGTIPAKIRYLNNTRSGQGAFYSKQYLLEGKPNIRDTYAGLPSDGDSLYGIQAGIKSDDGNFYEGYFKYSMLPLRKEDWAESGSPALTQRTLQGFMSRTFVIENITTLPKDGLFFRRSNNTFHTVLSSARLLYDYTDNDHPNLTLGNKPIPNVLKSILKVNGVQYDSEDLVYKGDTSTDQVIGHLFLYKIAFDVLNEQDEQEKQLKELIRNTLRNFCQHLLNNGYSMVDATGQATKWAKLFKQLFTSDYDLQDSFLKAIQLLLSFKLAHYVTGQTKWKQQYELLVRDQKFKYGQLIGHMWDRYVWAFTRTDDIDTGLLRFDYSLLMVRLYVGSYVANQKNVIFTNHQPFALIPFRF